MSEEEKEEIFKNAFELGGLVGTYGNKKQIEILEWFINDWNTKTETVEKLQKENQELKEKIKEYEIGKEQE